MLLTVYNVYDIMFYVKKWIMTTIGTLVPVSVSVVGSTRTGTELIAVANNSDNDGDGIKCYDQQIIDGFAEKDAPDKIYRIYPADAE